jgi:ABC-type transport system involved in multi-copper enzyme maturation permease subunit
MTAPAPALVRYTLRTAIPGKRWVMALIPCGIALLFGMLTHGFSGDSEENFARMAVVALFGLVLPVTSLVIGDAVLGAEVRRGTFAFTWMSPVPAGQIVLARWCGGTIVAAGCIAPAFALSAAVAGAPASAGAVALSGAFGAAAYVAVFMAIGCLTKRAAAWSIGFVFLVERLLGLALSGIAQLSPSWEARSAFVGLVDAPPALLREGIPDGVGALVRLALITAVALTVATRRLPRLHLTGSAD